ncbi:MAG: hypothetical protein PWP04_706 [Candidatus Atribacteria bacterium]|nr:hypothetical protein [Candidatus Atribacteria bacterium]
MLKAKEFLTFAHFEAVNPVNIGIHILFFPKCSGKIAYANSKNVNLMRVSAN